MSKPDPLHLECCACHIETTFEDQGQALGKWGMQENDKGIIFALCPKCNMSQEGRDIQTALIMGKKPPELSLDKPETELTKEPTIAPVYSGLCVKATFKLVNVEVSSGGRILSGEATPADAIVIGKDLARSLEIGRTYYVSLT